MAHTNYINLARKYRPQVVEHLIGQETLVKTLENSFILSRISHAFMLTGIRGIGKTTTARIIAKALNCVGTDGNGDITLSPCGVCSSCISITEDRNMDVIEIDAASKTGVDDIREIIESSHYKPVNCRYKVFIIDEVHMLSKSAFNALLKTLEEPPPHLKFIFATTEIRKVPVTVLSRCQNFYLKRIPVEKLTKYLQNICLKEEIPATENALFILAKAGNGSVRDSLSLLDQAIVYTDKNIVSAKIIDMLGQGNKEDIYKLVSAIISNNAGETFSIFSNLYGKGIAIDLLLEDILEVIHNISLYKQLKDTTLLEVNDFEKKKIIEIAQHIEQNILISMWQALLQGYKEVKSSNNWVQMANMLFVKLLYIANLTDLADISVQNNEKKTIINLSVKELGTVGNLRPTKLMESTNNKNIENNLPEDLQQSMKNAYPNALFKGQADD